MHVNTQATQEQAGSFSLVLAVLFPLALLFLLALSWQQGEAFVDTALFHLPVKTLESFPIVHALSNAYHNFRLDPLASFLANGKGLWMYFLACFIFGSLLLVRSLSASSLACILVPSGAGVGLLAVFGFDTVLLASLAYVPLILWLHGRLADTLTTGTSRPPLVIAFLILSLLFVISANQLALPLVFSFFLARIFFHTSRYSPRFLAFPWSLGVLFGLSFLSTVFLAHPPLEHLPLHAHYVPDYGTREGNSYFFGHSPSVPSLHLERLRDVFHLPSLLLFCLALMGMVVAQKTKKLFALCAILSLLLLLSSNLLSPTLSQMSPLHVLERLIPGLALLSLMPLCLAGAMLCFIFALGLEHTQAPGARNTSCIVLLIVLLLLGANTSRPLLWQGQKFMPFLAAHEYDGLRLGFASLPHEAQKASLRPSLHLLHEHGLELFHTKGLRKNLRFESIDPQDLRLWSNSRDAELLNMLDENLNTRARLGTQPFQGNEYLLLQFAKPSNIFGFSLVLGSYHSDFPRGFSVFATQECPSENLEQINTQDLRQWKRLAYFPNWQGPIRFSRHGLPFYGPQGEVEIVFPEQKGLRCLLIQHISTTSVYDWSVAELKLAVGRNTEQ